MIRKVKKYRNNKRKSRLFFLLVLGGILSITQAFSQTSERNRFPYEVSLTNGKPNEIVTHAGSMEPIFDSKGVILTTDALRQFSGFAIDHLVFGTNNGITVEFEYLMYGGVPFENKDGGDGITFFLYDGSKEFSIGMNGAALGYTYNKAMSNERTRGPGLNGAYLGIGIDHYGNFKNKMWRLKGRIAGLEANVTGDYPSVHHSQVTLRGAMHPTGLAGYGTRMLRYSGYPVLFTTSTQGGQSVKLNPANGKYTFVNSAVTSTFSIRPAAESIIEGDSNYRKVMIDLVPGSDHDMIVTVKMQHGSTVTKVIDKYVYPKSLYYTENANSGTLSSSVETATRAPSQVVQLETNIPATFKMGFAAATGDASQYHIIRNLKVSLPYFPITKEDLVEGCSSVISYKILPFANDAFYKGAITLPPVSGNDASFINYSSFRFENKHGEPLTNAYTYTQSGVGTWVYNPVNAEVTFTPIPGYIGLATIYYSAKGFGTGGGPFDQEIYRSGVTKIEIDIQQCRSNTPTTVRINPFLSR